ncbi:hypothetical protein [Citrobacter freundii]|uniref:Uncharacterized protein n=1 Tax=Citrobacter freundii TaxID=546 RepID=A0A7G2IHL3_CITFR|nr:hypothetical protein [Citrobacter freundii]
MDTDDICVAQRFELQLNEFSKNKELTLLGGALLSLMVMFLI